MLQTTSSSVTNKLISIKKKSISGIDSGKVIVEADVVGKKSEMRFFTLKARLAFAKLK